MELAAKPMCRCWARGSILSGLHVAHRKTSRLLSSPTEQMPRSLRHQRILPAPLVIGGFSTSIASSIITHQLRERLCRQPRKRAHASMSSAETASVTQMTFVLPFSYAARSASHKQLVQTEELIAKGWKRDGRSCPFHNAGSIRFNLSIVKTKAICAAPKIFRKMGCNKSSPPHGTTEEGNTFHSRLL